MSFFGVASSARVEEGILEGTPPPWSLYPPQDFIILDEPLTPESSATLAALRQVFEAWVAAEYEAVSIEDVRMIVGAHYFCIIPLHDNQTDGEPLHGRQFPRVFPNRSSVESAWEWEPLRPSLRTLLACFVHAVSAGAASFAVCDDATSPSPASTSTSRRTRR